MTSPPPDLHILIESSSNPHRALSSACIGEVDALSPLDNKTPAIRICVDSRSADTSLKSGRSDSLSEHGGDSEEAGSFRAGSGKPGQLASCSELLLCEFERSVLYKFPSDGCFGQSVLLGRRRPHTCVAFTQCEILAIDKPDLKRLLADDPMSSRRICRAVLKGKLTLDRLARLAAQLRIGILPRGELRAALVVQFLWQRYVHAIALEHDEVFRALSAHMAAVGDGEAASGGGPRCGEAQRRLQRIHEELALGMSFTGRRAAQPPLRGASTPWNGSTTPLPPARKSQAPKPGAAAETELMQAWRRCGCNDRLDSCRSSEASRRA